MSTFYTTCAKCGDEIGSAHNILWLAARPFHPECATERDMMAERDAAVAELLEAAKAIVNEFLEMSEGIKDTPLDIQRLNQAIANYVRLRDE